MGVPLAGLANNFSEEVFILKLSQFFQACVEFFGPLSVICTCNIALLLYIRKRRAKMLNMRKEMLKAGPHTGDTSVEHSEDRSKTIAVATIEKSLKKTAVKKVVKNDEDIKRNAEIKEIKKEQRATRSLLILVGSFLTLWVFYELIGNFIMPWCQSCISQELYQASYWPTYHLSAIDPLIYAITIERFRYHFLVFFSFILPWCVRHPGQETKRAKNKVQPAKTSNTGVRQVSSTGI